jgi:hypothetical protein
VPKLNFKPHFSSCHLKISKKQHVSKHDLGTPLTIIPPKKMQKELLELRIPALLRKVTREEFRMLTPS